MSIDTDYYQKTVSSLSSKKQNLKKKQYSKNTQYMQLFQ